MRKKIIATSLLVALNACIISGCGATKNQGTTTDTQTIESTTESTTENITEDTATESTEASETTEQPDDINNNSQSDDVSAHYLNEIYKDVLDKYRAAINEKWDYGKCVDEDICPLITNADALSFDDIGAALIDMDNDGYDELIIGDAKDTTSKSVYEIWTYDGNSTKKLISAQERCLLNVGYMNEDNLYFISAMGSNSAAEFEYDYYTVQNGNLQKEQSIISEAVSDTEMNWYQCDADSDARTELDEDTANAINASYSDNWFLPQYLSLESK